LLIEVQGRTVTCIDRTNICFDGPERRDTDITLSGSGRVIALDCPEPGPAPGAQRVIA
jgi:hypothetical protein